MVQTIEEKILDVQSHEIILLGTRSYQKTKSVSDFKLLDQCKHANTHSLLYIAVVLAMYYLFELQMTATLLRRLLWWLRSVCVDVGGGRQVGV